MLQLLIHTKRWEKVFFRKSAFITSKAVFEEKEDFMFDWARGRKRTGLFVITLLFFISAFMITSCTQRGESDDSSDTVADRSEDKSSDVTYESADSGSDSTSESETQPVLWEQDTGKFNEGKVRYEKVISKEELETLPDDRVGTILSPGQTGVSALLKADFEDGDALLGGDAVASDGNRVGAGGGHLCLPYSPDNPDEPTPDNWITWSHNISASVEDYKQVQLSMDIRIGAVNAQPWSGVLVGCYVSDYSQHIPAYDGEDGLWFGFNPMTGVVTVYNADQVNWPAGLAQFTLPEGLLDGDIRMDIICLENFTTSVYVSSGSDEPTEIVRVTFADGKISVFDHKGEKVAEDSCTTDNLKGGHFVLFPHDFGTAAVDNLILLTGIKSGVREKSEIKATPLGDNSLGLDITDRDGLVSMCYSVWHDAIHGMGDEPIESYLNITDILAGKQEWGGESVFHYWAKPAQGYYRASDKTAIRNNMTMLYNAGVDFINVDLTHVFDSWVDSGSDWMIYVKSPLDALLDTVMEMRAEGLGTPYVVLWYGGSEGPLCEALYEQYYSVEKWRDCFVYWDGKPLILTRETDLSTFPMPDQFTVRGMWGLLREYPTGQWSCMNIDNRGTVSIDADGKPEQIAVVPACQETYMSEPTAHGRNHGILWYTQWHYAFEVRPKIVGVAWWNEWAAQRLEVEPGKYIFTDTYNQEYSRDIEPMEGGHGALYYEWLCSYISAYKGGAECPLLVEEGYEDAAREALE